MADWVTQGYDGTSTTGIGYTLYSPFTIAESTTITKLGWRVKSTGDKMKIAITDGTSWLTATYEVSSTVDGWNDVDISSVTLTDTSKTYYIAVIFDNTLGTDVYSDASAPYFAYNNNDPDYKPVDYNAAFDVVVQGTPIVKATGSQRQNSRYYSSDAPTPPGEGGVFLPPEPAMVRL